MRYGSGSRSSSHPGNLFGYIPPEQLEPLGSAQSTSSPPAGAISYPLRWLLHNGVPQFSPTIDFRSPPLMLRSNPVPRTAPVSPRSFTRTAVATLVSLTSTQYIPVAYRRSACDPRVAR